MGFIDELLNGNFMPHGHCLLWRTDLLFLHVGGDVLTFIAYLVIPIALIRLVRARDDLRFDWMVLMFAGFIFFCGTTHIMGIINIWHGYYFMHGIIKALTGIISIMTAMMLWHLLPFAKSIPSKHLLQEKIDQLTQVEQQLAQSNLRLESEVAKRTAQLAKANLHLESEVVKRTAQLEQMATTDELTGLLNRREIMRILDIEIERANRQRATLSIMMLDLDHFKAVNDNFGHQAGDRSLQNAAEIFKQHLRKTDFIGRIGGEEFLFIVPETAIGEAAELAERIRQTLELQQLASDNAEARCTASIGVVQCLEADTVQSLIQRVDDMLYQAKTAGRNRVCQSQC
jgi:diguanylate cyclase (GGDEF)-like protein